MRRLGVDKSILGGGNAYHGPVDATPLFVVLLGEASRWGLADDDLSRLLPHAEWALEWVDGRCEANHDGCVHFERSSPIGLVNQGWKDSADSMRYADARIAEPPLALCEVQGYTYAARLALALRPSHEKVDSSTSNPGHCLWSGIVDDEVAPRLTQVLPSPPMFTGWGIRTPGEGQPLLQPDELPLLLGVAARHGALRSRHGPVRSGRCRSRRDESARFGGAALGGRLPELFSGFDRQLLDKPIPVPMACAPQAWSEGAALLLVRVLLGIEPHNEHGITASPITGAVEEPMRLDGLHSHGRRVSLRLAQGTVQISESEAQ